MQTGQDDAPRRQRPGLLSLDPLQWLLLVAAVLIGVVNLAGVALDADQPAPAIVSHVVAGVAWPLFGWGMLPKMRIARLSSELDEIRRRDREAVARRLSPTWPSPRDWCVHIGFTLVLGGMVLSFPVPAFRFAAAGLLLVYGVAVTIQLRATRKRRPTAASAPNV